MVQFSFSFIHRFGSLAFFIPRSPQTCSVLSVYGTQRHRRNCSTVRIKLIKISTIMQNSCEWCWCSHTPWFNDLISSHFSSRLSFPPTSRLLPRDLPINLNSYLNQSHLLFLLNIFAYCSNHYKIFCNTSLNNVDAPSTTIVFCSNHSEKWRTLRHIVSVSHPPQNVCKSATKAAIRFVPQTQERDYSNVSHHALLFFISASGKTEAAASQAVKNFTPNLTPPRGWVRHMNVSFPALRQFDMTLFTFSSTIYSRNWVQTDRR